MALVFVHGNKYPGNPILSPSESYDARGLREPFIYKTGGVTYIFYDGCGTELTDPYWTTCLATCTDLEGEITKQGRILDVGAGGKCIGPEPTKDSILGNAIDYLVLTKFLCYKSGTVDRIKIQSDTNGYVDVGIYADDGGEGDASEPSDLLVSTLHTYVTSGTNSITITGTALTKGTLYWLASNCSVPDCVRIYAKTWQRRYKVLADNTAFPNPAGGGYTTDTTAVDIISAWVDAEDPDAACACAPMIYYYAPLGAEPYVMFYLSTTYLDGDDVPAYPYTVSVATSATIDGTYTKYGGNPVLDIGGAGTWDHGGLSTVGIVIDPSDPSRFLMIYTAIDSPVMPWVSGVGIAYCDLADFPYGPGGEWTRYESNPIMAPPEVTNIENIRIYPHKSDWYFIANYIVPSGSCNNVYKADDLTLLNWTFDGVITPQGASGEWDDEDINFPGAIWDRNKITCVYGGSGDDEFYYNYSLGIDYVYQSIQPPTIDTRIIKNDADTNYGTGEALALVDAEAGAQRSIMEFDLDPVAEIISSAKLKLYFYSLGGVADPSGLTVKAHKLTHSGWDATGPDWVGTDATWNIYKSATSWTAAGGDYEASSPTPGSVEMPASFGWVEWDILAIVQDAIANDNQDKIEILLKFDNEAGSPTHAALFYSSELAKSTTLGDLSPRIELSYYSSVKVDGIVPGKIDGVLLSAIEKINGMLL